MIIDKKLLLNLVQIPSPSGMEQLIKDFIIEYGNRHLKKTEVFVNSGEVFYVKKSGKKDSKTVLFDAHIDHISMRIMTITRDGFLICRPFGINKEDIYGKPIKILTRRGIIDGVITINPPHLDISNDKLIIDIFVKNREEAEKLVVIGDPVFFEPYAKIINNFLIGTSLDNHIGVYSLIKLAQQIDRLDNLEFNIVFHFSSREETGGLKYLSMVDRILPNKIDLIFVVDADLANDVYNLKIDEIPETILGGGPIITRNIIDDPAVYEFIMNIIGTKIPYQIVMSDGDGGNNLLEYGKLTLLGQSIGIPLRYMHSSVETCSLDDIRWTIKLLYKIVTSLHLFFRGEK